MGLLMRRRAISDRTLLVLPVVLASLSGHVILKGHLWVVVTPFTYVDARVRRVVLV